MADQPIIAELREAIDGEVAYAYQTQIGNRSYPYARYRTVHDRTDRAIVARAAELDAMGTL